jgi:hypothetical protein
MRFNGDTTHSVTIKAPAITLNEDESGCGCSYDIHFSDVKTLAVSASPVE